mmetsp:Transcript_6393/g.12703  ORF Transcript_6393/g.12703 Transcript_6393/m.12703 type:complete len:226 (+) Transcript_6393:1159-1836(+)
MKADQRGTHTHAHQSTTETVHANALFYFSISHCSKIAFFQRIMYACMHLIGTRLQGCTTRAPALLLASLGLRSLPPSSGGFVRTCWGMSGASTAVEHPVPTFPPPLPGDGRMVARTAADSFVAPFVGACCGAGGPPGSADSSVSAETQALAVIHHRAAQLPVVGLPVAASNAGRLAACCASFVAVFFPSASPAGCRAPPGAPGRYADRLPPVSFHSSPILPIAPA